MNEKDFDLIKERVVDYIQNKKEVDKWIALKGECKYEEFANILEAKGISCNWSALDNLARYDKRLLINVTKHAFTEIGHI